MLCERFAQLARARRADAGDLGEPLGMLVDDVERFELELLDEPARQLGADSRDLARREKLFDADERLGRRALIRRHAKLLAPLSILHPVPAHAQRPTLVDTDDVAEDRDDLEVLGL